MKIHLHNIYRKLRVSNRTELILSAIPNRRKKIHGFPLICLGNVG